MNPALAEMTESQWAAQVETWLRRGNWIYYHTRNSRGSVPGFPDYIAVHPERGILLAAELKTETGKVTRVQQQWLDAFGYVDAVREVWRPSSWRRIEAFLCGTDRA